MRVFPCLAPTGKQNDAQGDIKLISDLMPIQHIESRSNIWQLVVFYLRFVATSHKNQSDKFDGSGGNGFQPAKLAESKRAGSG
ncbi:hypothetical protein RJ45_20070 [Photobacterium gaetbulicola]|uniref:Uncharacterized protein n=1 Tax=Photobacterium gaetbulicola TaxID=1295392 RepID=A0A0B9GZ58_9GAMM|nr:hypothetical protein RJ45_20070 [Photobacterium gaetbulicola]